MIEKYCNCTYVLKRFENFCFFRFFARVNPANPAPTTTTTRFLVEIGIFINIFFTTIKEWIFDSC